MNHLPAVTPPLVAIDLYTEARVSAVTAITPGSVDHGVKLAPSKV